MLAIGLLILLVLVGIGGFLPIPSSQGEHLKWIGEGAFQIQNWHIGPFPITGTLIASWFTIVVLVGLYFAATRKMRLIPKGIQNAVEMVNEMLSNFCESVAGEENGRRFFPIVATIFLYVIMIAFLCLIPGFGAFGYGHYGSYSTTFYGTASGFVVEQPLLYKATTDISIPLMLALMSFIFVEYWGISSLGFRHYVSRFFRIGGLRAPLGQLFRGKVRPALSGLTFAVINMFAGFIELISEFIRIISFTFRLFGNMTAGEVLLIMICVLAPLVVAVPFYGLEMILGFVQALIFGGLTLVFATMAVRAHGAEE
jgi:F-type H+-transporting ATPase subunit a